MFMCFDLSICFRHYPASQHVMSDFPFPLLTCGSFLTYKFTYEYSSAELLCASACSDPKESVHNCTRLNIRQRGHERSFRNKYSELFQKKAWRTSERQMRRKGFIPLDVSAAPCKACGKCRKSFSHTSFNQLRTPDLHYSHLSESPIKSLEKHSRSIFFHTCPLTRSPWVTVL